jgi:hypothetical protein
LIVIEYGLLSSGTSAFQSGLMNGLSSLQQLGMTFVQFVLDHPVMFIAGLALLLGWTMFRTSR